MVRNESKVHRAGQKAHVLTNMTYCTDCFDLNSICDDPKGGDLWLDRVKPEEIQVEARTGADVQIAPQIWLKGRKTNRIA